MKFKKTQISLSKVIPVLVVLILAVLVVPVLVVLILVVPVLIVHGSSYCYIDLLTCSI